MDALGQSNTEIEPPAARDANSSIRNRHYEYYILPASKEYLADIVLLTMYNVDNTDLLSITPILHRTLHFAESCQRIEIV